MSDNRHVLILGAGAMGHGIALCFADAGWPVTLYDPFPESLPKAIRGIETALDLLCEVQGSPASRRTEALRRLATTSELPAAIPGIVIEAAPEKLPIKQELLREIEQRASDDTLLCTNTSAIRIDQIAAGLAAPDRLVGTHFWNPPYVLPCVEVIRGSATSEATMERTMELLRGIGRRPVRLNRDVPGFVGNRLQHALQREALALVEEGVVTPADLDEIVTQSFGMRLALMGPFERADLGGLDTTTRVHEYLLPHLDNRETPSPLLTDKVASGQLGIKTGQGFYDWTPEQIQQRIRQRDTLLLQLIALLGESAD